MGRKNKGGKHITKRELMRKTVELFQENPGECYELRRLYHELALDTHPAKMLCMDVLEDLLMDDFITEKPKYCYSLKTDGLTQEGIFHRKSNGKNTFISDEGGEPILVAERNSMHAMDGDRVKVNMVARRRNHVREAVVTEILQRSDKNFVGKLQVRKDIAFLLTEDRTLANDIFIPRSELHGGKDGDKVIVKVTEWPDRANNPIGKVITVLGPTGDNETEMHAILAEYGLPISYPKAVEDAANRIPDKIPQSEIDRREDMRDVTTFTIDPKDAKDFDDALSVRQLSKNLWEVGVHIADVSHYVTEGDIIDREAVKRATSIYLVDRTIPMLPERLCNKVCSLRPDEDKLTYSVVFVLNAEAEVKDWHLAHTVTRSNRRFTYEEVDDIFDGKAEDALTPELNLLNDFAKKLRQRRFDKGAVDFDRLEPHFDIDEKGRPVAIYFNKNTDSHKLVEEFMLLANRTVAESIGKVPKNKKPKTFVYRIHDLPDPNKLMNLSDFVMKFGHKLKANGSKTDISKNINKLLHDVHDKPERNVIEMVTLRAMMKAKYSTENIGHYGLAFDYYTHFTSPIRRYPDLMVHRLLTRYSDGGRSAMRDKYEELSEHSSEMEQLAAQAERSSIKYKQVEFMQKYLGEEFDGTISGITEFGIYVEINENKCEGFVSLRDLDDDYYFFDERNFALVGRRHHNRFSLGDCVRIKVARANLERKQLDFVMVK